MGRTYSNTIMAGSPMLAADISQLRGFIDQDIAAAGLSPHPWSWSNVVSGEPVLAVQFKEMKDAIQRLWDFKARGPLPMWSSGRAPGGPSLGTAATPIFASDLTDLRTWLNQYEDNHPPSDQGVDSLCFDPRDASRPIITDAWAQDIKDMALDKPLFVRANIKCRDDNSIPLEDKQLYSQALNLYRARGLRVFALFAAGEFEVIVPGTPDQDPKADLEEDFANPYISFSGPGASCGIIVVRPVMNAPVKLLVATNNQHKLGEYRSLLEGLPFNISSLSEEGIKASIEEDGSTFQENALLKARGYASMSGLLTMADDSGLEVEALGGEPGVRSSRYAGPDATDAERISYLLSKLKDVPWERRKARFRATIAIAGPGGGLWVCEGSCEGFVNFEPRGGHGFGYDPVFYLPDLAVTMAELPPYVKNRVSHRAEAVRQARKVLAEMG